MAGFGGKQEDLLDDAVDADYLHSNLQNNLNNNNTSQPPPPSFLNGSQRQYPNNNNNNNHTAITMVPITMVNSVACQTEVMEDLSFLPSAHPDTFNRNINARLQEAKQQEQRSLFHFANNKVHPEETLELDAPRRLQARVNIRQNLGFFQLLVYDLKRWFELQRTQRRDPVFLWRTSIKLIEGRFGTPYASFFVFIRWMFLLNAAMAVFWFALVVLPNIITFDYSHSITLSFSVDQLLSGRGAVGQSWMFYGSYAASAGSYRMDMAYVAVTIIVLISCAMFVIHTMVQALRPVHSSGSLVNMDKKSPYSVFVFTSFDHALNDKGAILTLQQGIVNAIRDHLNDDLNTTAHLQMTPAEIWKLQLTRAGGWAIWAVFVTGSFVALWYIIQTQDITASGISAYSTVLVFATINSVFPMAISIMTKFEKYTGPMEMKIAIGRSAILRTLSLWAVLYGLYQKTDLLGTQLPLYNPNVITPPESCAGQIYGQELWRLLLVDTIAFSATLTAYHLVMYRFWYKKQDKLELDIPEGVLSVVYRQGLTWVGMVFCPVLPILSTLSLAYIFMIYYLLVKYTCKPPVKRWTQSRHNVFFFFFLLIQLIVSIVPLNIALQGYKPNCGPYGDAKYSSMYGAVNSWLQEQNTGTRSFAAIITNPAFIFPLLVALGAIIYYHRVRLHQWQQYHVELLRELDQLRADKKCLLARGVQSLNEDDDAEE